MLIDTHLQSVFSSFFCNIIQILKPLRYAIYNCRAWKFTDVKLSAQSTFTVILNSIEVHYLLLGKIKAQNYNRKL